MRLLARANEIFNLERQPRYKLVVNDVLIATYVADWRYQTKAVQGLSWIIEDAKGVQTPAFKLKWKLAKTLFPFFEWRLS